MRKRSERLGEKCGIGHTDKQILRYGFGRDEDNQWARTVGRRQLLIHTRGGNMRQNDARFSPKISSQPTIQATRNLITVQIPHRHSTNMDLRDSISKPFKNLKRRVAKGNRKRAEGPEREHDTEGCETSQSPHPEAEDVVESGPSQKENEGEGENVVQVHPPAPTPSIDNEKPDSERTKSLPYFLP